MMEKVCFGRALVGNACGGEELEKEVVCKNEALAPSQLWWSPYTCRWSRERLWAREVGFGSRGSVTAMSNCNEKFGDSRIVSLSSARSSSDGALGDVGVCCTAGAARVKTLKLGDSRAG
jgi:hypothetical protein